MRAAQIVVDESVARPTLIGRPKIIAERVEKFGLRLQEGRDYDVVNVEQDDRYRDFWQTYHRMTDRKGVTVQMAKIEMRRRLTLIGAMLLHKGPGGRHDLRHLGTTDIHLRYLDQVIGKRAGVTPMPAMNGLMLPGRQVFLVDTHVNYDPTRSSSPRSRCWRPRKCCASASPAALLSHSNFGSSNHPAR